MMNHTEQARIQIIIIKINIDCMFLKMKLVMPEKIGFLSQLSNSLYLF